MSCIQVDTSVSVSYNTGWFTVVSMQNTEFILILRFVIVLFSIGTTVNPIVPYPELNPKVLRRVMAIATFLLLKFDAASSAAQLYPVSI